MISGDPHILTQGSEAYSRLEMQMTQVEQLDVFVWPQKHSWREISLVAQKNAYDVVTAQDPFWRGLIAWRVALRVGTRLNLQVHTDILRESLLKRALARFLLPKADTIRVVSEKLKKHLEQFKLRGTISVLPIYVETSHLAGLSHHQHPSFEKTLLWIGRFEKEKDPTYALIVLKQVRDAGVNAGLIMLGAGSLERKLLEHAKSLMPYVEFPGWQDPKQYLEMANVVISTSLFESYGASIIEALASGVPVVSPDVGIAREAGAVVVPKEKLSEAVIETLNFGKRGKLNLTMPSKEDWAKRWKETL